MASAATATVLQFGWPEMLYSWRLIIIVSISTCVWLAVTLATQPVDESRLLEFVKRVRPGSPGWAALARRHGVELEPFLGPGVLRWLAGCGVLFGLCFGLGNLLLGKPAQGLGMVAGAGILLWWILRQIED